MSFKTYGSQVQIDMFMVGNLHIAQNQFNLTNRFTKPEVPTFEIKRMQRASRNIILNFTEPQICLPLITPKNRNDCIF